MKGFSQSYQVNYDETFTPVIKWDSICILLNLAACLDLEIHQMDIKTAFLNGDLNHTIYMEPPPGSADFGTPGIVWKLEKSLYGLKQALSWNLTDSALPSAMQITPSLSIPVKMGLSASLLSMLMT